MIAEPEIEEEYDPILDVALEEMHGIVGRMGDEERAAFCLLSDYSRGMVILTTLLQMRDRITMHLMCGGEV